MGAYTYVSACMCVCLWRARMYMYVWRVGMYVSARVCMKDDVLACMNNLSVSLFSLLSFITQADLAHE